MVCILETIVKGMHVGEWRGAQVNILVRLVRRGRGCQRLEECDNSSLPADGGDARRRLAIIVLLVEIEVVTCKQ